MAITAAFNGECKDTLILLPTALRKSWIYQWLPFIVSRYTSPVHCVKGVQILNFFWSVSSRIWTECGELFHISLYSAQMRENTDQKKLRIWTLFRSKTHDREFYWSADHEYYAGLRIWSCRSSWSEKKKQKKNKKNPRRLMLLCIKWGLFRKKNSS